MRRYHLFEFEDQAWFPSIIRDAGTAYLTFVARTAKQASALAPILARALRRARSNRIVDLCSGGSGPLPSVLDELASQHDLHVTATLTDLYPNQIAFDRILQENSSIEAVYESVDATSVPASLDGVRTLFSGFHHFRPALARRILTNAFEKGDSIAIFEVVARDRMAIGGMFFVPLLTLFSVPFLRPFRWGWIPLTYLIPVIPFFILWDGIVSCLRCYTQDELREMTAELKSNDYEWEIGAISMPHTPFEGTYLIGSPTSPVALAARRSTP